MKDILKVSILFVFALTGMSYAQNDSSETQFIKYRNYLIPIDVTPETPPISEAECPFTEIPITAQVQDAGDARVIIMSDMAGADNQGSFDPDDIQSLVHALTFSDQMDIEGIMSAPRRIRANANFQSELRFTNIVNAFGADRQTLVDNFGADFPTASDLLQTLRGGAAERYNIFSSGNNEAVEHIIERARCGWHLGDARPLYVLSWGSNVDFARAVVSAPDIKRVVRLVSYSAFNEGGFEIGNIGTDLSCAFTGAPFQCQSWNYLRTQSDLWWVDYTGGVLPLANCNSSELNTLSGGGALGNQIIANGLQHGALTGDNNGNGERCVFFTPGFQSWLKLGDSITTAFVLNPANERNNPTGSTTFGNYFQPQAGRTYWQLIVNGNGGFSNAGKLYSDWLFRAARL